MLTKIIDAQYRRPSGLLGRYIGRQMAQDHLPENLWTVALLDAQPADKILEVGFGAGIAIAELAAIVTQGFVAGVDYSRTMVGAARKRNAAAVRAGRVHLQYGKAAALPFEDDTFDKVFSIHSIYFWPDPVAAIAEIYRALKPGGRVFLTVLPKERWPGDDSDAPVGTPECRPYSGAELTALLAQASFKEMRIESDDNSAHASNYSVIGLK